MKQILFFFLVIISLTTQSQTLYQPPSITASDSILVPVNVGSAVRKVYNIDLVKFRAAKAAGDTATVLRILISSNAAATVTNATAINNRATNSEVVNFSHVAFWGDSFTASLGGFDATYPSVFAALTGYTIYNGGVGGQTSTQIKARFDAATDKTGWSQVIWVGKNDVIQGLSMTTLKSNIASIVAALGHSRYLIIGVTPSTADVTGSGNATTINTLNSDLATIYGTRFFDVAAYLKTQGTGTGQDATDVSNGIIPSSLKNDAIHLNKAGYALVAAQVAARINLFQTSTTGLLQASNAPALSLGGLDQYNLKTGGEYQIGGQRVLWLPNQANNVNDLFIGNGGLNLTSGTANTSGGVNALLNVTTGAGNTAFGSAAASLLTIQSNTTALGYNVLYNVTGSGNTGVGSSALSAHTSGTDNTAVGYNALLANQSGSQNVAVGQATIALGGSSASNNTAIGYHGLLSVTGSNNTALGSNAGGNVTSGGRNLTIGADANVVTATVSNQVNIANLIYGTGASGTGTTPAGQVSIGINTPATSALLDLTSTTKGLLLPRMTKTQRDAIGSPFAGLSVYQTDNTPGLRVFNGTNWMRFTETSD